MYVLISQGKEVPYHILECAHSYDYPVDCVAALSEELKSLDSETFERIVKNTQSQEARDLSNWWEMHQEAERLSKALYKTCL
jgi:energy-converting hydrogenase A subunit M